MLAHAHTATHAPKAIFQSWHNQSKMKELDWSQHFSHYMSMFFPAAQGLLTLQYFRIWLEFDLLRCYGCPAFMNEEDLIKNEGARVATRLSPLIYLYESNLLPWKPSSDPSWPKT